MRLETERVRLEPWRAEDGRAFHRISTDREVMRYIAGGAPWSKSQTREFVGRQIRHFKERGFCLWKLLLKDGGGDVDGFCGIQPLAETNEVEIGWWLARRHWGKGIATEAAREVLRDAFERTGLARIVAIALAENKASLRVMEKLGMKYEREHVHRGVPVVLFAVAKEDWAVGVGYSGQRIRIREANDSDVERIVEITNAAFSVESFLGGKRTCENSVRLMMQFGDFFVGEEGGTVNASIYLERRGEHGYFGMLAVDPARQTKGAGRAMIGMAEEHFRKLGCNAMDITVLSLRTDLPPYYRKLGYVENGTMEFHPTRPLAKGAECHIIKMTKGLGAAR
jgi:RimJ/RimL family protein N-acetyltransferase